jgi:outer membrane protein assembly factor BamB
MGSNASIFCHTCGELILEAAICPACGTPRPAEANEPGSEQWRSDLGQPLPRPRCYAALAGGRLCLPTEGGAVVGLDLKSGARAWEHALQGASAADSLASDGTRVFVGPYDTRPLPRSGRALLALDGASGSVVWQFDCGSHSYSGAAVFGDTVFLTTADGAVHALDAASGAVRWSKPHVDWGPAAPAVIDGLVVAGGRGEQLAAYDMASGEERWRFEGGGWFATPAAIVGDVVAAHCWDGYLYGLDVRDGSLRWKLRGERGQGFSSPPVAGRGVFLIGDRVARARAGGYALRALRAEDGAEQWRHPTGKYVSAPVAVSGDLVLCPTEAEELLALDRDSGALRWRAALGADATSQPLVAGEHVLVADHAGGVYALRLEAGRLAGASPAELLAAGEVAAAAAAYVLGGEPEQGARLYNERLDQPREAALIYEHFGMPAKAAPLWEQAGELQRARDAFRAAGDVAPLAEHLDRTGEQLEAARLFEQIGKPAEAATLYAQAGDKGRAAELYAQAGQDDAARSTAASQDRKEQRASTLIATGKLTEAAALLAQHGQQERAAELYEQDGALADALLVRLDLGHWERAADLALRLGDLEHAAVALEQMGQKRRAAEIYEQAATAALATPHADERLAADLYEQAARLYGEVFETERAAGCEIEVRRYRQLPTLEAALEVEHAFAELEWNTATISIRNTGFGPARSLLVRAPERFDLGDAPVLAGLMAGREARMIVSLRPKAQEIGQRVPLTLTVAYLDAQGQAYEARAATFVRVAPRSMPPGGPMPTPQPSAPPRPQAVAEGAELDLTLRFEQIHGVVEVRWEADVLGVRESRFVAPYRDADLSLVIRALDRLQSPSSALTPDEALRLKALGLPLDETSSGLNVNGHQAVGRALFRALTADPQAATALSTARDTAAHGGRTLGLRLRFAPDAIELAALPWELLWDRGQAPLLMSQRRLASCTRHLDLAEALPQPRSREGPLRILAITPHTGIDAELRERERADRTAAWADLIANGEVVMEEISPATRLRISERMLSGPTPDIVHFVGHGRYLDGEGWIVIDDGRGGWDRVQASRLMPLFSAVRLVVLCACQGAMVGDAGLLTGVAPALSAAGVPAVVAMQLTVRTAAATRFSEVMYRALARGESLQRAVVQARQALYVEETDAASWYVPTLTIRARDPGPLYFFAG